MPVISIGNLSVGGTGKTPHVEFLARHLSPYLEVATLSRGYRRRTRGFLLVEPTDEAEHVGDEPLQIKRNLPEVTVAVAENRLFAVPRILMKYPQTQVVLLDDAFQHLTVRPGLSLLLTEYAKPYYDDYLLPAGSLREFPSGAARADAIIVTKCPPKLTEKAAQAIVERLAPLPHQKVFFSTLVYGRPYQLFRPESEMPLHTQLNVLFFCGIASPDTAVDYLKNHCATVYLLTYPDHHYFENGDIRTIIRTWHNIPNSPNCILTTEKDAARLEAHRAYLEAEKIPIFVLPVRTRFLFDGDEGFLSYIKTWLLAFR